MNALLHEALDRVSSLPEVEQEIIASLILDELAAERAWEARFAKTDDALGELVRRAQDEVAEAGALTYDPGDRPAH